MNELELFHQWFKLKFPDLHESICCGDLVAKKYKKAMFKAWQASVSREGYKLVPVEPTQKMIDNGWNQCSGDESIVDIYVAMIESAP